MMMMMPRRGVSFLDSTMHEIQRPVESKDVLQYHAHRLRRSRVSSRLVHTVWRGQHEAACQTTLRGTSMQHSQHTLCTHWTTCPTRSSRRSSLAHATSAHSFTARSDSPQSICARSRRRSCHFPEVAAQWPQPHHFLGCQPGTAAATGGAPAARCHLQPLHVPAARAGTHLAAP